MTPVRLERDGGLAVVTLDQPPLNLFTSEVLSGLRDRVEELHSEPARAVLFRAEGSVVSGGVDVNEFDGLSVEEATTLFEGLISLAQRVEELPLPTVFAAHGLCLTAAFELALACDLILAAEEAQFGLVETVIGLTPAMGGTQRLAERAGPGRARELVMTGRLYAAGTLEAWNVVNRIWPGGEFDAAARRYAQRLADGPTRSHLATKRIVRAFLTGGVREADALTPGEAGALFGTEDLKGATRSFLTEGPGQAKFEGR